MGGKFWEEKKDRFCIETQLVQKIQDTIKGIIPIFDAGLPDEKNKEKYWYTMPIAEPIAKKFTGQESIEQIANCVIELANIMNELHKKGIVHRDIKPSNIYFYKGGYCFGDFGLVDYPDKGDLTQIKEPVGAKATIAPEMKRNAKDSDGKKADVYSLAKTLWMLLTRNETGFDGTYDAESKLMGLSGILRGEHIVELEELLYDSTREEPELRPTMEQFAKRLKEWLDIRASFEKSNLSQWKFIQNTLFGKIVPDSAKWSSIDDIITVLNFLGRMPDNHMFIPSGGGEDFESAEKAGEDGCICIRTLGNVIIKPKCLYVENIQKDYIWSYFRLELDELKPIYENDDSKILENLTEDVSGHYISWKCGNYGYYEDGTPLPNGYRLVCRYLKGSFVIFAKSSIYNDISGTYDARHSKMTSEEFRNYILNLRRCSLTFSYEAFMELANKNPFAPSEDFDEKEKERKKQIERYKKCKEYVIKNINQWDFSENTVNVIKNENAKTGYYIKYEWDNSYCEKEYLCKNGKVQCETETIKRYLTYDRNVAIKLVEELQNSVKKQCEETSIVFDTGYEQIFNVGIQRLSKPSHLFTYEELEMQLRNGNDSKDNRLVIDADGYVKLIEECAYLQLYPVRFEEYCAYNNYVGKYANLTDLNDEYIMCLQGWLLYLESGKTVYMDYKHKENNIEKLIEEIRKFY